MNFVIFSYTFPCESRYLRFAMQYEESLDIMRTARKLTALVLGIIHKPKIRKVPQRREIWNGILYAHAQHVGKPLVMQWEWFFYEINVLYRFVKEYSARAHQRWCVEIDWYRGTESGLLLSHFSWKIQKIPILMGIFLCIINIKLVWN